ncbi:hypothetical protein RvY_08206-1 [Ramazzottius varieornatus]|uniref:Uncharacterized protein n=1 Tax=Ramazzottius varieornatus TaxID=947166 RepID=A0A1D1V517_RAMVA|nr:hypothetical protein RvY_08206-1 [Ramazzottius varieornatus]
MTDQYFCYDQHRHSQTSNTFMTGIWARTSNFYIYQTNGTVLGDPFGLNDDFQPIKCCKTPTGYYIDYVSCYYMPTHDMYWEYYDAQSANLVFCAQGYVMVAAAKKKNPYRGFEYTIEWIQCCRVGFGQPVNVAPPIIYSRSGSAAYYAPRGVEGMPPLVAGQYKGQYRQSRSVKSSAKGSSEENPLSLNNTDRTGCFEKE